MAIAFKCPTCTKDYRVPDEFAGRTTRCRNCNTDMLIPKLNGIQAAPTMPAPPPFPGAAAAPDVATAPASKGMIGGLLSSPKKLAIIGGGAVAALFLVCGAVGAVMWLFGSSTPEGTKYLPNNTLAIVSIKVSDLVGSEAYQDLKKASPDWDKNVGEMEKEFGIPLANMDRALIAWHADGDKQAPLPALVVSTKEGISTNEVRGGIKGREYKEVTVNGYAMQENTSTGLSFCVVEKKMVVYAAAPALKAILERDKKPDLSDNLKTALKEADASKTIAFAADVKEMRAKNGGKLDFLGDSNKLSEAADYLAGNAVVGKDVKLTAAVACPDATAADDMRAAIDGLRVLAKKHKDTPQEVQDLLGAIKVSTSGNKATVNGQFKGDGLAKMPGFAVGQPAQATFAAASAPLMALPVLPMRSSSLGLEYLPSNTHLVIAVRFDEMVNSPVYKDLEREIPQEQWKQAVDSFRSQTGLDMTNLSRTLIGGSLSPGDEPIFVLKTKTPVTAEGLLAARKEPDYHKSTVGRYTLYEHRVKKEAFCVADSTTVVAGHPDLLRSVLERGKKPEFSPSLEAAMKEAELGKKTMTFALNLQDAQSLQIPVPGANTNEFKKLFESMETLSGSIICGNDLKIHLSGKAKDAESAENVCNTLKFFITAAKIQQKAPIPKEAMDVLNALKFTTTGTTVLGDLQFDPRPLMKLMVQMSRPANQTFERVGEKIGQP